MSRQSLTMEELEAAEAGEEVGLVSALLAQVAPGRVSPRPPLLVD